MESLENVGGKEATPSFQHQVGSVYRGASPRTQPHPTPAGGDTIYIAPAGGKHPVATTKHPCSPSSAPQSRWARALWASRGHMPQWALHS